MTCSHHRCGNGQNAAACRPGAEAGPQMLLPNLLVSPGDGASAANCRWGSGGCGAGKNWNPPDSGAPGPSPAVWRWEGLQVEGPLKRVSPEQARGGQRAGAPGRRVTPRALPLPLCLAAVSVPSCFGLLVLVLLGQPALFLQQGRPGQPPAPPGLHPHPRDTRAECHPAGSPAFLPPSPEDPLPSSAG